MHETCIAAELEVPRGSRGSTSLFVDVAIFRDASWRSVHDHLLSTKAADWSPLYELLIGVIEVKDDLRDNMDRTVARQVLPALASANSPYVLGGYFNAGHLAIFSKTVADGVTAFQRLDPAKQLTSGTPVVQLNLAVPDTWDAFPSHDVILRRGATGAIATRAGRHLDDLDVVSSRTQYPIQVALNSILRVLDATGTRAETGYRIVVEALAVKIYDEKSADQKSAPLRFYIDAGEDAEGGALPKEFRRRMEELHDEAKKDFPGILLNSVIRWTDPSHRKVIGEVVKGFQDISFTRSAHGDLYQVVFYNFAGPLAKIEQSQFMTPLRVIEFLVEVINPRPGEKVLDPTMGIADFLAVAFTRGRDRKEPLVDSDLYGIENDANMLMLATLNMLLNGDGNARLFHIPDTGSLDHKLARQSGQPGPVVYTLSADQNSGGNWDPDDARLDPFLFDAVLTNPPFGDGRALKLNSEPSRKIARLYEVYESMGGNQIDKGLLFLENAVRSVRIGGRVGIVLSTAIAGVAEYEPARMWLLDNTRVVGLFDLPANIFAETGVPTTLIVAYRPPQSRLAELRAANYEVFARTIDRVGFAKVTRGRNTFLVDRFLVDPNTGMAVHDPETGRALLDEEFSDTARAFKDWARLQEPELQAAFL